MIRYIVCCPNCGSDRLQEVDYQTFECGCGEEFDLENAEINSDC